MHLAALVLCGCNAIPWDCECCACDGCVSDKEPLPPINPTDESCLHKLNKCVESMNPVHGPFAVEAPKTCSHRFMSVVETAMQGLYWRGWCLHGEESGVTPAIHWAVRSKLQIISPIFNPGLVEAIFLPIYICVWWYVRCVRSWPHGSW